MTTKTELTSLPDPNEDYQTYSSDSENYSDSSDESDQLSPKKNSDLYVVSVDGSPMFYVKDEQAASKKMWSVAFKLAGIKFFAGDRTNFLKISDNELHLIGSYRFFLIAYDRIIHTIRYSKVSECTCLN